MFGVEFDLFKISIIINTDITCVLIQRLCYLLKQMKWRDLVAESKHNKKNIDKIKLTYLNWYTNENQKKISRS